jgi:hypothetical protein
MGEVLGSERPLDPHGMTLALRHPILLQGVFSTA